MKKHFPSIALVSIILPAPAKMKVMTYNIKYANEKDGENSWSQRKEHLGNQVAFHEPDILGVQEGIHEQLDFIKSQVPKYEYIGTGRDGENVGEFSAIFYDASRFEVLQHDTFWLSETPEKISRGWDAAYRRVCTHALFMDRKSGKKFWVFNTHFDHVGVEARKRSARLLVEKIGFLNSERLPMLLMGDFNLEPDSEEIQFLSKEYFDSRKASEGVVYGSQGTFNGFEFHDQVTRRIDYIFTDKEKVRVLKYGVLSESKDLKYPSDHFPVLVELSLSDD